ncbi:DUF3558 domain-containing protein [Saccharopolyspora thermophila]|uniref:DUF3558 domain-containing protein n=1 Tax=Saccharopolyspora thermophila TaxID=89367 RepID=UPI001E598AE9|nr:DUF3558 domain-containing protein [Saccharopolyspora subtropica]
MTRTSVRNRSVGLATGIAMAVSLTACSGSGADTEPTTQPTQAHASPEINNPKDASRAELCQLLPADAAQSLGLNATGEKEDTPKIDPNISDACWWRASDGSGAGVALSVINGSITEYQRNKTLFTDYQELDIAGHPAVRGNRGTPLEDGYCDLYLATSDHQILHAHSNINADGKTDPCGLAQKALEASIPTLPAAK